MQIAIIDGRGGKLGAALTEEVLKRFPQDDILAVGINDAAAEQMRKTGAKRCASGENPVLVACRTADLLLGSMELVLADSMLGEVTPCMAKAVSESGTMRILVPMHLEGIAVAGVKETSASELVQDAVQKAERWKKGLPV